MGTWCESYLSYHGRSHGHVETTYETWSKQVCREKSAEAIVPGNLPPGLELIEREGLNLSYQVNEDYQMEGRKQKISKDNCRQKVGAEHRGYVGVPTSIWITENNEVTPPHQSEGGLRNRRIRNRTYGGVRGQIGN